MLKNLLSHFEPHSTAIIFFHLPQACVTELYYGIFPQAREHLPLQP